MDAFSGYNQIRMHPDNEEKMTFVTNRGLYCYKMMPFGLKNAGASFQRLINKVFENQIGRNMEAYVDDMIVKSLHRNNHIEDLTESFDALRRHRMKLNPTKCTFGVTSGKFLGFLVTKRGIEANPEKIKALTDMKHPNSKKDIQRLTNRIASLSRFISVESRMILMITMH